MERCKSRENRRTSTKLSTVSCEASAAILTVREQEYRDAESCLSVRYTGMRRGVSCGVQCVPRIDEERRLNGAWQIFLSGRRTRRSPADLVYSGAGRRMEPFPSRFDMTHARS